MQFHHITGIKNNTRTIGGGHTKLRTTSLRHTGIKNNTRIIVDTPSSSARHAPHIMGIKNNTHVILEHAPPSPLRLPTSRVLKLTPASMKYTLPLLKEANFVLYPNNVPRSVVRMGNIF